MFKGALLIVACLVGPVATLGQTRSFGSPNKATRAVIIPVGAKGHENSESRIEIRSARGRLLRRLNLASADHNHGEGIGHAQWTGNGGFFVFITGSSGGHQPWHVATYFYSVARNRFYSLDAMVGRPIISDFTLRGDVVIATRMGATLDDPKSVAFSLNRWR
ncbi:MAG TPA: hypothetical protein VNG71_19100 [Pyrinomonadaceae bacterium]|nr:hypothetical protein [Pyrinomonadaceae bacterium]